ncbi:DUF4245 family protein [Microbacterium allomyrinae]|uniref:DUF4245 family protein n=1 Tax=Microbacterium allomyrinae TaxID=2830666 RepID=A0A9X1LRD0_9MICO|nr:DUF4245 family protein [Microbacterium allomyrinae]MCC2030667.1 DUF4245 family protein [Microbacterium allomyrinae]
MAQNPRIVAELGRPETPDETAARKAESSRIYRSSQNTRNLVAALLATLAVVVVIIFAVPRGTPPEREPIDVAAVAAGIAGAEGRTVIAPEMPEKDWLVNRAGIEGDGSVRAWTIVYAAADEDERSFLRVAQGFDADPAWAARMLSGASAEDTVTVDGIVWDRYELDASRTANITAALVTTAGPDTILIYGAADIPTLTETASTVTDQVIALREESE